MKPLWFALALALVAPLVTAPAVRAQDKNAVAEDEAQTAMWVQKLDAAKARMDDAKAELLGYLAQKSEGAARNYPVGDAKAKYIEGIQKATAEYEAARKDLPDVVEEARRAGIVPGVLDPYEQAAEAAVPVAQITDDSAAQANPGDDDVQQAAQGDSGVDDDVENAKNTDTREKAAKNTDTPEEDPGPQTEDQPPGW